MKLKTSIVSWASLPGLIGALTCSYAQEVIVDWEAAAARAAQTERGFYATDGARDTQTLPEGYTAPVIDPKAHIRESDRQVAAQAAKRLAEQRAAERAAATPLAQQLQRSRVEHGQQLRSLSDSATSLQSQLQAAKEDKKRAEATQKQYNAAQTWYGAGAEIVAGVVTDTSRTSTQAAIDSAQKRIDTLQAQLRNTQSAIRFKTQEVQDYERRMQLEITKEFSSAAGIEKQKRVQSATALATELHTQEAQIVAGQQAFSERIATLDAAIRQAEKNNLSDVAEQFRKDRTKTYEIHQQWLANQNSELNARQQDLRREFSQNREDGIGPTNESILRSNLRTQARAEGKDPETAVDFVDETLVDNTAQSASQVAAGAPGNTEHLSIFNEVSTETLLDFAQDYRTEARVTYGSWDGFKSRVLEGYGLGLLEGGWGIVKDLFNLIVEIGDTAGESIEDMIERMTGAQLDVFGDENMQKLREFLRSADALIRDEDGAGLEEAKKLVATAEAIRRVIDRKAEQMAGSGEKGLRQALNITGQVAINLVGIEAVAVQGIQKGAKLLRGAGKLDDLGDAARAADILEDTAGVGRADDAARAGSRPSTGSDPGASVDITNVELSVTQGTSARGNPTDQIAGGRVTINGETAILTPETEIGAGSFTTVYTAKRADGTVITGPNGKPLVVRVTKASDDGLDQVGLLGLNELEPGVIGVPEHFGGARLGDGAGEFSGGTINIVERAPDDFNKMRTGDRMPDGTTVRAPDGTMTAGQAIAFDTAMRALNEKGLVWLDNKGDNFSFEHLGGDNWRLVVVDPGGILPVTGLDPATARKMQRFIDDPQALREAGEILGPNLEIQASSVAELLNREFPEGIDYSLINRLTGRQPGQEYGTLVRELEGAIPFNPENGLKYPKTGQLARAETPEEIAAAHAALRAEQEAQQAARTSTGTSANQQGAAGGGRADNVPKADDAPPGRETGPAEQAPKSRPQTGVCPPTTQRGLVSRIRRAVSKLKSNIVGAHAEVLSDVAVKRNEVVMVRPVNQFSTRLITDNYPTKGMGIKGKSADWGPHRGTIPVDPTYSKLGNPNRPDGPATEGELFQYYNYNRKALGQPYYKPSTGPDGSTVWQLQEAEEAIAKIVTVDGPDGPIEVLGDLASGKPITADYDLFAVGSKNGPGEVGAFDNNMGAISENEVHSMNAINNGVRDGGFEGGNVVHHGPANRFADELEAADFPVTAFTPDGNMHSINNVEELSDFYNTWNALGYKLESRPGWNLDPNIKPTGKFGPLSDNPTLAELAAAAGIVTTSHAGAEEPCGPESEKLSDDYFEDLFGGEDDDRFGQRPTTGGGGGGAATGLAMGFDGMPVVPPIYFEFGEQPVSDTFSGTSCSGSCDSATDYFGNGFEVELLQVFPRFGNNPFNPNDPLENSLEDDFQSSESSSLPSSSGSFTPSVSSPPPMMSPPPTNPLAAYAGSYGGTFGCGVSVTTFASVGTNQITLTLPGNGAAVFNINGSGTIANSQSTNLMIFGANDHTCRANSFSSDNQFDLICTNTGGGLCSESFNK